MKEYYPKTTLLGQKTAGRLLGDAFLSHLPYSQAEINIPRDNIHLETPLAQEGSGVDIDISCKQDKNDCIQKFLEIKENDTHKLKNK